MKFDVIIGNPPYQKEDGGYNRSAVPLYQEFIMQAKFMKPQYIVMIIPAKWYAGGKNLDTFRKEMLCDNRISELHDFTDNLFFGVQINGGICYFKWERDYRGLCKVVNYLQNNITAKLRPLRVNNLDILIRYNDALPIVDKVCSKNELSFKGLVSGRKPFGLPSYYKGEEVYFTGAVKLYQKKGIGYIDKSSITKNKDIIDKWKIFISAICVGGTKFPSFVINLPIVGSPNTACTETYLYVGPFEDKRTTENVLHYMNTRFFRFLVLMCKPNQQAARKIYTLVPMQDFSRIWTDDDLYKKYELTADEITFIERLVRSRDVNSR